MALFQPLIGLSRNPFNDQARKLKFRLSKFISPSCCIQTSQADLKADSRGYSGTYTGNEVFQPKFELTCLFINGIMGISGYTTTVNHTYGGILTDLDDALTHSHTPTHLPIRMSLLSSAAAPPSLPWDRVPKFGTTAFMFLG